MSVNIWNKTTHILKRAAGKPGLFTRLLPGLVPTAPSGSGTSKYLREDGTWNEPDSGISYGTCTTAAATAAKVVTLSAATGWELKQGASVAVKFSNTNTFSATDQAPVTLNVNNTGAKNIYYGGSANPTGTNTTAFGRANYVNTYVYDGTYWVWTGSSADNNTTYSAMSTSELTTGTATTSRVVRADYLHAGIEQIAESAKIDTANNTATFTSSDTTDASATSWTSVTKLASGESHTSIFAKMSQMFKNIRYLYKMLGTTDISSIGDGTVTGGLDTLKDALNNKQNSSNAVITRNTLLYVATGTAKFNIGSDSRFDITKPLFGFVNKSDMAFDFCIIPFDGLHIANGYSAVPLNNMGASASIRFYNNCTQVGIAQVFINGVDETADAVLYLYTQI